MSALELKVPFFRNRPMNWLAPKLIFGLAAAVVADWLFLDHGKPGLSLVLFLGLLALIAMTANPVRTTGRALGVAGAILLSGLIALTEDVGPLSFPLGVAATLIFALMAIEGKPLRLVNLAPRALRLPLFGALWLAGDIRHVSRLVRDKRNPTNILSTLVAWIVPAAALVVFGTLFASANPLLESWFSLLDPRLLFDADVIRHLLFWVMILCLVWPFLHLRTSGKPAAPWIGETEGAKADDGVLFGESAIRRSLILLNALFALQTALDLAYLWAGMPLPYGMSYAAYAHRGAYPLVLTALLAAAFVLIAMRRGGPAERSEIIRPLVLVWVGQNVLLMISSILRLNLYVAAYSLTYLRLAALIWMGLVAVGLLLIVAQIIRSRSNAWLLEMNARALALALWGACLLNFPATVANYNVSHSYQIRGSGPLLDEQYLWSLGAQAIPAIDTFARVVPGHESDGIRARSVFASQMSSEWRAWSFREWRLRRYLAINRGVTPSAGAAFSLNQH